MGNITRKTGTITIDVYSATDEHNTVQSFVREVQYDGKTVFKDEVKPSTHFNGNDLLSKFIRRADYEAGYRCDTRYKRNDTFRQRRIGGFQSLELRFKCFVLKQKCSILKVKVLLRKCLHRLF